MARPWPAVRIPRPARSTSRAPSPATRSWCRSRSSRRTAHRHTPAACSRPYTVDPQAIAARIDRDPKRTTWTIDKARGVVRLDQIELQPGGIELPLKPMLGCVGVAPARKEAIGTSCAGRLRRQHGLRLDGRRREVDAAGQRARRAAVSRRRPRADGRRRNRRHRPRDLDGRRVQRHAGEEEGRRLAAARERHPRDGPRQRPAAAGSLPARDDRAAEDGSSPTMA